MELCVGTSGYSYKEWKGPFYPERLPASRMLAFYAERLPAVEINNTFYRMPKAEVLRRWAEQVPASFRFALKASRRITHFKRLVDAQEETDYLLRTADALGERLGVVLFQLPPQLRRDVPRLEAFLERLPAGTRTAFEFRHPSWRDEDVHALLCAHDAALVASDGDGDAPDAEPLSTARWGYWRLRRSGYERADLATWAGRLASQPWERAFVFFKHEDAGAGPRLASELLELAKRARARKGALPADARPARREAG